jgi:DNA-binding transcriptional LysR family regulator
MAVDLKHIRHALVLARHRNFARAAEALHLTQPSLSRSIATLERDLGVPLFDRGKKGIEPTAYGRLLLARGEALLGGAADLRRELRLMAGLEAGRVAIAAGPYPTEISVGRAVTRLLRAHPRLKVEVVSPAVEEIVKGVLSGRFDLGILGTYVCPDVAALSVTPLGSHRLRMACRPGHPLTALRGFTVEDLLRFPLVGPVMGAPVVKLVRDHDAAGDTDVEENRVYPAVHVSSHLLARQIAADSDAVCFGTAEMLAADVAAGRLVSPDFWIPEMRVEYALLRPSDRSLSPAAQAFVEALEAVEAELAQRGASSAAAARAQAGSSGSSSRRTFARARAASARPASRS